jgi:hypothetical protein
MWSTLNRLDSKTLKRAALLSGAGLLLLMMASLWASIRSPAESSGPILIVNDVSQLNPIAVAEVMRPKTTREITEAVRRHSGAITIGGARHSMGGQMKDEITNAARDR